MNAGRGQAAGWHGGELDISAKYANPPVPVGDNLGAVMDTIKQRFGEKM